MNSPLVRLSKEEFFALPDYNPEFPRPHTFGLAPLKMEGMPVYRDSGGYAWVLQETANGARYRVML